jgi:fusion and transport protein UGO1
MLPSYFCPTPLMLPTILHSLITPAISHSTPHLLRSQFGIDPVLTPTTYGVCKFLCQIGELFVKLPFETVLRRGQVAVLASPVHSTDANELQTTVDIGPYKGVVGTMWSIAREEGIYGQEASIATGGVKAIKRGKKAEKRGQGIEGLWRGWRVGMWGLVGVWGARAMGTNGSNGGEF